MRLSLAVLGASAVLLAACAGGSTATKSAGGDGSDQPRRIDVEMKGVMKFTPTAITLRAGERVVISLRNNDSVEHEFMAGRGGQAGVGYKEDLFSGIKPEIVSPTKHDEGGHSSSGGDHAKSVGIRLGPGETGTLSFVVPNKVGDHEFGCFVAGHYESAMKGKLTIGK